MCRILADTVSERVDPCFEVYSDSYSVEKETLGERPSSVRRDTLGKRTPLLVVDRYDHTRSTRTGTRILLLIRGVKRGRGEKVVVGDVTPSLSIPRYVPRSDPCRCSSSNRHKGRRSGMSYMRRPESFLNDLLLGVVRSSDGLLVPFTDTNLS